MLPIPPVLPADFSLTLLLTIAAGVFIGGLALAVVLFVIYIVLHILAS